MSGSDAEDESVRIPSDGEKNDGQRGGRDSENGKDLVGEIAIQNGGDKFVTAIFATVTVTGSITRSPRSSTRFPLKDSL
ncbi:hypothetical protein TIFTF001_026828 [Ficus carica]|uniref:Uncharacterized protein n=1 Tax=Ficus carica TaxID=3494 RepID=A0AA88DMW4_FICCA|nr:hypothetical protein TIFTF001_026828 [Ficus carica]